MRDEPLHELIGATPEGQAALSAAQQNPDLLQAWGKGELVPPLVAAGLRRLWTASQLLHRDGKTLLSPELIEGAPTVVMDRVPQGMLPVSEGMFKAIDQGKQWRAQVERRALDAMLPTAHASFPGMRIGETQTINGVQYRLEGTPQSPRWRRVISEEAKARAGRGAIQPGDASITMAGETGGTPSTRHAAGEPGQQAATQEQLDQAAAAIEQQPAPEPPKSREDKAALSIIEQANSGPPPTIALLPEVERSNLQEHQLEFIRRAASAYDRGESGFLLGDDTGTGKTISTLGLIAQMKPKRVVIVVPNKGLIEQWEGDVKVANLGAALKLSRADNTSGDFSGDGVHITTYASFYQNPSLQGQADLVVWDECDALRNQEGIIAGTGDDLNKKTVAAGGKVLFMSATPYQKLEEAEYLWPLGLWDRSHKRGFDRWLRQQGVYVQEHYGMTGNISKTYEKSRDHAARLLGLNETMARKGNYMHREMRMDGGLQNEFPERGISAEQRQLYDTVMRAFQYVGLTPTEIRSARAQQQAVAMRMLEAFMVPHAVEIAKRSLAEGKQVALFTQAVSDIDLKDILARNRVSRRVIDRVTALKSPADALVEALGGEPAVARYYGDHGDSPDEYNSGRKNVMVLSFDKGGTGLSLHDKKGDSPRVQINLSIPYSGKKLKQVAGRSYRLGSKSSAIQYFLLPAGIKEARHFAKICATKLKHMGAGIRGRIEGDIGAADLLAFEMGTDASRGHRRSVAEILAGSKTVRETVAVGGRG